MTFRNAEGPRPSWKLSVLSSKQNHNQPLTIKEPVVLDLPPQPNITQRPCPVIYWVEGTSLNQRFICVSQDKAQASEWTCQSSKKFDEAVDLKTRISIHTRLVFPFFPMPWVLEIWLQFWKYILPFYFTFFALYYHFQGNVSTSTIRFIHGNYRTTSVVFISCTTHVVLQNL